MARGPINHLETGLARNSAHSGFHRLTLDERATIVAEFAGLDRQELDLLSEPGGLALSQAQKMVENVVGVLGVPLGIATNMRVNDQDYMVPMAIEEPSVIAAQSYGCKLARQGGGFQAEADPPRMIGQIQVVDLVDVSVARDAIEQARPSLLDMADALHPTTVSLGGGARDLVVRELEHETIGQMLVVHLVYDVRDVMGANTINSTVEALAPEIERITGGRVLLRVLSNLADQRLARARVTIPHGALARDRVSGQVAAQRIVECAALAEIDPYRAVTHNKGIMNGIDALALATGNDWRSIEAGAHAYAARAGRYGPLSTWRRDENGDLSGQIEMSLAVGIMGGTTRAHPQTAVALDILGVRSSQELAEVMVAVGLAQNLAALRALAMEGIQRGHMALHARQVAMAVGAKGEMIPRIAQRLVDEKNIRSARASALLEEMKAEDQA